MKIAWTTLLTALAAVSAGAQGVDLALVNGRLYTADPARPWAEAVAIAGDRIVAVGTSAEVRRLAGPRTRVIDLRRAFAIVGGRIVHESR